MDYGKWELCPYCQQIRFTSPTKEHECPVMVREWKEELVAEEAEEIMYDFNRELDKFWKNPEVKFMEHLAENGDI